MPGNQKVHGLRERDHFRNSVDLDEFRAVKLLAKHEQGDSGIAPNILGFVGRLPGRDHDATLIINGGRNERHLRRTVAPASRENAPVVCLQEFLRRTDVHKSLRKCPSVSSGILTDSPPALQARGNAAGKKSVANRNRAGKSTSYQAVTFLPTVHVTGFALDCAKQTGFLFWHVTRSMLSVVICPRGSFGSGALTGIGCRPR